MIPRVEEQVFIVLEYINQQVVLGADAIRVGSILSGKKEMKHPQVRSISPEEKKELGYDFGEGISSNICIKPNELVSFGVPETLLRHILFFLQEHQYIKIDGLPNLEGYREWFDVIKNHPKYYNYLALEVSKTREFLYEEELSKRLYDPKNDTLIVDVDEKALEQALVHSISLEQIQKMSQEKPSYFHQFSPDKTRLGYYVLSINKSFGQLYERMKHKSGNEDRSLFDVMEKEFLQVAGKLLRMTDQYEWYIHETKLHKLRVGGFPYTVFYLAKNGHGAKIPFKAIQDKIYTNSAGIREAVHDLNKKMKMKVPELKQEKVSVLSLTKNSVVINTLWVRF